MKMIIIHSDIIERESYTEKVAPFIGKQIIKVLTGQRRYDKKLYYVSDN